MAIANVPAARVILGGQDLTSKIAPHLVELTLTEKRGGEADQLDLVIDDVDGRFAIPRAGVALDLALGWKSGSDVVPGLIAKGTFTVDEIEHSGPPDRITVRARAADFTAAIAGRRERSWHDTTLGQILRDIAGGNGLVPRISAAKAAIPITSLVQSRESDIALLRRLGREHDAIAAVKRGALLFGAIGAGVSPGGSLLASTTIRRRDGDSHSYRIQKREEATAITASYNDVGAAEKKHARVGAAGGRARRLARVYPDEASARTAAAAELGRSKRQPVSLELKLALGRADLFPDRPIRTSGFKPAIDATPWLIAEVTHRLSGTEGFRTDLTLEAA